jgi:glyoxylase-like metal-dependent hydrolase (beta-lactamase superfamily II)
VVFESVRTDRGCVSYLIGCTRTSAAIVVDPELSQVDRYLAIAAQQGLRIRYLLDTHTHADHFSGVCPLAQRTGALCVMHQL